MADSGGIEGGAPPWSALGSGASGPRDAGRLSCSSHCLMSGVVGTAGGRCCRNIGTGFRHSGLPRAGCEWGAYGVLVLVGRVGLLHVDGPDGTGRSGVMGSGILVAIRWISALVSRSWVFRVDTRRWCAVAHSSTFPWKLARC